MSALLLPLCLYGQLRPVTLEDLHRFQTVGDPRCSPDGKQIAYTLSKVDVGGDRRDTDIWVVGVDGKENFRMTTSTESESTPRYSPDGKWLSFQSSRPGKAKGTQVWVMDRRGGEAQQLTAFAGRLTAYEWSPDSRRLLVILREEEADEAKTGEAGSAKPKPIVVDRYAFKRDGAGYLTGEKRNRIHLYDIETKKLELVTDGNFDETGATFSPDRKWIAFSSVREQETTERPNADVWIVEAKANSTPRRLTTFAGSDTQPEWSPDGKLIAYLMGSEHRQSEYNMNRLAVVPVEGGPPRIVTASLDRGVSNAHFSPDGRWLEFLATDDMSVYPMRVGVSGGGMERMVGGKFVVSGLHREGSCVAALVSDDGNPPEIHALEGGALRRLTNHNGEVTAGLRLVVPEEISARAKDGNEVHGLLYKPVGHQGGAKYPLLLRIHGGPNGQDAHSFRFEEQLFAAQGYAVLTVNYRGSSGRGQAYTVSIAGEWGHKEVVDLHAAVDHVVGMGVADPERLGVGGWSYGGILTNYLIASDARFRAATSGAGVAFPLSFYGHDQYIRQYDHEIGAPWKKGLEPWIKISYPFLHADRIRTPTMFLCGDRDFNVPLLGSEQMYQALRNVGTETQLIIYPGENHGILRPSFQRDRLQRYLDWYQRHLRPKGATSAE
jgi:dipeptidyl aminopeptidase/acylaminoacyl peptidase